MGINNLINYLLEILSISKVDYDNHRDFYNNHFDEYQNDIYEDPKTRIVHLENFWDDSLWFNKRYELLFRHYKEFDQIIELGFSLPYLQLKADDLGLNLEGKNFLLVDSYKSAIEVSDLVIDYLDVGNVNLVLADIQEDSGWDAINKLVIKDGSRLFVAVETVEHLDRPDVFWDNLSKHSGDGVVISLPVGPAIPSHHLVMDSEKDALDYLSKYINVSESMTISPQAESGRGLDEYKVAIVFGTIK